MKSKKQRKQKPDLPKSNSATVNTLLEDYGAAAADPMGHGSGKMKKQTDPDN